MRSQNNDAAYVLYLRAAAAQEHRANEMMRAAAAAAPTDNNANELVWIVRSHSARILLLPAAADDSCARLLAREGSPEFTYLPCTITANAAAVTGSAHSSRVLLFVSVVFAISLLADVSASAALTELALSSRRRIIMSACHPSSGAGFC